MRYLTNMAPAILDMWIFIGVAFFGAWAAAFATDDAAKYIIAPVLFWLKSGCAATSAGLLAAKMFRSTGFSDHLKEKRDTQFMVRGNVP